MFFVCQRIFSYFCIKTTVFAKVDPIGKLHVLKNFSTSNQVPSNKTPLKLQRKTSFLCHQSNLPAISFHCFDILPGGAFTAELNQTTFLYTSFEHDADTALLQAVSYLLTL